MDNDQAADAEVTTPTTPTDEQREAAFLRGIEGKPTATPAAQEEAQTEEPAPDATPQPKFAQITEEQWNDITARAARIDEIKAQQEKQFGTFGNTLRNYGQKIEGLGVNAIRVPKEKLDRLRADLPEVAELFDELQATKAEPIDQAALIASVREALQGDVTEAEQRQWQRVAKARASEIHEDWEQVTGSQAFADFALSNGAKYMDDLRQASTDFDYRVITRAVGDFKAAKSKQSDKANARRERLDSNIDPRGSAPPSGAMSAEDAFQAGLRKVKG